MNILHLIIKEIKQNIRDKKGMAMMILFPILLILVLGNALKGTDFYGDDLAKSKVLYSIQSTGTAAKDFKENIIDKGKELNIDFTETKDIEASKKLIKDRNEYDSLIIMKDDTIDVYKNSRYDLLSGLSESILSTYVQRYNTIAQISKVNPKKLNEILSDTNTSYTNIVSLDKGRAPSSLDYYTITMITL
jgi:ABC-2 type transport system permease protein